MLNALSVCLDGGDPEGRTRASRSFARQGFVASGSFAWEGGVLEAWGHPGQLAVENASIETASGFACCVGPLWYRGRFGKAALALLVEQAGGDQSIDEAELRGNFALLLCKGKDCVLFNDAPGFVRIHASADGLYHSTSWLATCAYSGAVDLDEEAATEYVLLGASHSDATVARGITTLPLGHVLDCTHRHRRERFPVGFWTGAPGVASFDEAVTATVALLRTVFKDAAAAFPGQVRAALSGGFDSRLILAGLLASGVRPELFVYGAPDFPDVPVARAVAESAGIPLRVVDKAALNAQLPPPGIARLVQAALFFDGLPNDGIDDPGADQQTRLEQLAGGCLGLNGGGGEIFRNYFHLPDRHFDAIDIVRTFYRGFDTRVFRRRNGLRAYETRMAASIERALGHANGKLTRQQVELLYPLFRCHHWMAVNNSVAVRHGYYVTPLADVNTIRLAGCMPLAWKNAGRLEARLIAKLHEGVASQASTYGFRFSDGPDQRARCREWATQMRPVFARPLINATRRRLHGDGVRPATIARYRALLPGEWQLDSVLDLSRLPDDRAFARALAVEVVWRELVG